MTEQQQALSSFIRAIKSHRKKAWGAHKQTL
jgi:hypothetical protein